VNDDDSGVRTREWRVVAIEAQGGCANDAKGNIASDVDHTRVGRCAGCDFAADGVAKRVVGARDGERLLRDRQATDADREEGLDESEDGELSRRSPRAAQPEDRERRCDRAESDEIRAELGCDDAAQLQLVSSAW